MNNDWYERRHDLEPEMVLRHVDGSLVKLDSPVPGDGSKWYVATWTGAWSYYDDTVEPCDLTGEPLSDPTAHATHHPRPGSAGQT